MRPHFVMSSIGNGLRRLESRRREFGLGAGGPAPATRYCGPVSEVLRHGGGPPSAFKYAQSQSAAMVSSFCSLPFYTQKTLDSLFDRKSLYSGQLPNTDLFISAHGADFVLLARSPYTEPHLKMFHI